MISHIHHVNFVVKDVEQAILRYQNILNGANFEMNNLENRAILTARTKVGETWLILVQPLDKTSILARHLTEHGEGFFSCHSQAMT